jgi:hypothetical protein
MCVRSCRWLMCRRGGGSTHELQELQGFVYESVTISCETEDHSWLTADGAVASQRREAVAKTLLSRSAT